MKLRTILLAALLAFAPALSAETKIKTHNITDSAVTSAKIADLGVDTADIAGNAVTTAKVALDTLTAADLAPDSVGTSEIADGTVAAGDLASSLDLSGKTLTLPAASYAIPYLEYRDEKAAGTAGGTATSGSWQTRTLNTEHADTGNYGSVASNQITLAAGTYELDAIVPGAGGVNGFQAKLVNITDTADTLIGTSAIAGSGNIMAHSRISGRFTIAAQKVFEIQMRVTTTTATNGWGFAANLGVAEVYTVVRLRKVG